MQPRILALPASQFAPESSAFKISCTSYGNPRPEINWTVNGEAPRRGVRVTSVVIAPASDYITPTVKSTLSIPNVSFEDQGEYKCTSVVNAACKDAPPGYMPSAAVNLTVFAPQRPTPHGMSGLWLLVAEIILSQD